MSATRKTSKKKSDSKEDNVVSREDIVEKLDEIDEIVQDASNSGKNMIKIAIGVGLVILIGVAFYAGRKRALQPKTIVSFIKDR